MVIKKMLIIFLALFILISKSDVIDASENDIADYSIEIIKQYETNIIYNIIKEDYCWQCENSSELSPELGEEYMLGEYINDTYNLYVEFKYYIDLKTNYIMQYFSIKEEDNTSYEGFLIWSGGEPIDYETCYTS